MTLAEANRERAMTLAQRGTGTLRARDEAVAAHQVAAANVALAQARLEKATITAPFPGVVGFRAVSIGAYVTPGTRIVELANIDPIKIDFRVPELVLSSLRVGQPIRVIVDALPNRTFEGEIYVIDPIVDENGRAVRLRARIPNPDRRSEEHTSELQSLMRISYAVFCLKKKKNKNQKHKPSTHQQHHHTHLTMNTLYTPHQQP